MLISLTATSFVLAVSIGEATAIRVAYGIGRGDSALWYGAPAFSAFAPVLSSWERRRWPNLTVPKLLTGIFIDISAPENQDVDALAATLFAIAALFQVSDGIQAIMSRALRGMRDTLAPLWIAAFGYWGFGILGGYILAFPMGFGAVGLWSGLALGLSATAVLLTWRFYNLSRWPAIQTPPPTYRRHSGKVGPGVPAGPIAGIVNRSTALPLTSVTIQGYRSVQSLTLPVEACSVFVGANGVGKTNLYKALELLRVFSGRDNRMGDRKGRRHLVRTLGRREAARKAGQAHSQGIF